jgi:hypothetical protein
MDGNATTVAMGAAIGLTSEQIDELFRQAEAIEV